MNSQFHFVSKILCTCINLWDYDTCIVINHTVMKRKKTEHQNVDDVDDEET